MPALYHPWSHLATWQVMPALYQLFVLVMMRVTLGEPQPVTATLDERSYATFAAHAVATLTYLVDVVNGLCLDLT
jgi:hypothetical protein